MSSRNKANPEPSVPQYVAWRGQLITKLALTRAGLVVQEAPASQPFDFLASTPDGFYFVVEVAAYSSMHRGHGPVFDQTHNQNRWPVDRSVLRAADEVNLPAVLFVVDADREVGHYGRLDDLPHSNPGPGKTFVSLSADRDLSPEALAKLVSELRAAWSLSRRPA